MRMMRCVEPVWFGDRFVAKDTLLPPNDPAAVEPYFVAIDIGDDEPPKKRGA